MRLFGVLGGLTPEANAIFARLLHENVRLRSPGGKHSACFVNAMLNRRDLEDFCVGRPSPRPRHQLRSMVRGLESAGVKAVAFDSSAMHVLADDLGALTRVPLLPGIETCVTELKAQGITSAGLIGTRFTAEEKIWLDRLMALGGIHTVLPSRLDRNLILRTIDDELAHGIVHEASHVAVMRAMKGMCRQGAQGIVVAAPELSLLVHPEDTPMRIFDFAQIHSRAVVGWALGADKENG